MPRFTTRFDTSRRGAPIGVLVLVAWIAGCSGGGSGEPRDDAGGPSGSGTPGEPGTAAVVAGPQSEGSSGPPPLVSTTPESVSGAIGPAVRSLTCDEIGGMEALYWDWQVGVERPDYPQDALGPPRPEGGSFTHPFSGRHTYTYPTGWGAYGDSERPGTARVVRDDARAAWSLKLDIAIGEAVQSIDDLIAEFERTREFLQVPDAQPQVICSGDATQPVDGLTTVFASARMVRFGDYTGVYHSLVVYNAPVGGVDNSYSNVATVSAVAPTSEFAAVARSAFLPMNWQRFIINAAAGGAGSECEEGGDDDNDGIKNEDDDDCEED